ncbi:carboxypeptidase M32 [Pokkaliibacter sp. CJK22405]|uniref:carboxypeptidase M32 n=1 Tax=Pokkaliibacter sp. CJK22405 TaxID=3384615 RepID=UPI0039847969
MSRPSAYTHLQSLFQRLHGYRHLLAMAHWDQASMMPVGSMEARANAIAELESLCHESLTAPQTGDWMAEAAQESLDEDARANLREMHRQWQQASVLPADLLRAKTLAGARCEHAWRQQRPANDWQGFAANLREVVNISRQEAQLRAEAQGCSPYQALMNLYEPGMTTERIDSLFNDMKTWLPELITTVVARQRENTLIQPQGPFAPVAQETLGREIMGILGFDFERGRLDISTHPFCGGVPEDVRITTRYSDSDFTQSLMGIIHETGHARYEQNLPRPLLGQPVAEARSMGVHESQSLFFEMQLGRHPAFLTSILPKIHQHLGERAGMDATNLQRLYRQVEPGLIRVDADEVTYPCHVILRYEIERDLIEGRLEVDDLPEVWNDKMQSYLGLSTVGDYRNGCMQDIHWTDGAFGYFPSYTLGALIAAQLAASIQSQLGDLGSLIENGRLHEVFGWLNSNIWSQGSRYPTDELLERATGSTLDARFFHQHLRQRYLQG